MNYYQHNLGDYAKDTQHLSWREHGCYRLMLDLYYATERPFPVSKPKIYGLLRCSLKGDRAIVDNLLGQFFHLEADGWHHKRCDAEILRYRGKSTKAADAARLSWQDRGRANRTERMKAARALGTHTDQEWRSLIDLCGNVCVKCGALAPLVRDHIIPVYQGGSDAIDNIQPMCVHCNSAKGPDSTDHRPESVRSAFAHLSYKRTHSERSSDRNANQEPINNKVSQPPVDNSTSSAAFAKRLRDQGVKIEDQNPLLATWSAMAPATLNAAIEKARGYKGDAIPAAYLASVINDPGSTPINAVDKGSELGVAPRPGETMSEYQARVARAISDRKRMS